MYKNFEFESQNVALIGYEWPVDNPKAVVYLIHGIGEHAGRYDRVAGYFNEADITLISTDLRGHGRSPGKRGHIDDREIVRKDIDNITEFIKEIYPDVPLIQYGHSLGGNISLDYRLRGRLSGEPVGYLITSPWIKLVKPVSGVVYHIVKAGDRLIPTAVISQHINNEMLGNINLINQENDSRLRHQKISLHTAVEGFEIAKELMMNLIPDAYGGGKTPILLMHGTDDPICDIDGSRVIAKNYGDICEYIEWKGYLHELHNGTDDKPYKPVIEKMIAWILETAKTSL